jgi:UDPglucose 6-dehydrogenase
MPEPGDTRQPGSRRGSYPSYSRLFPPPPFSPEKMRVTVIGTGYVGLVVGACLSETGNDVICCDIDEGKIARLNAGEIPIFEPGLDVLVQRNLKAQRLTFTTDVSSALKRSHIIFIAVGTPPGEDGSADLQHVLKVAETIGRSMEDTKIVITKSTVPVGTAAKVRAEIEKYTDISVHVCSNPEFLKEGAAVDDFMKPDRVVLGVDSEEAGAVLSELYRPFVRTGNQILLMDVASAEITKYAANAMLATRISFMNMIAARCEKTGADVNMVRTGVGSDERIGSAFLFPGIGYGGSCFPKDVKALVRTSRDLGVDVGILEAVEALNARQKELALSWLVRRFGEDLSGRTIAVWGLAFKPNTDDMREAPALVTIEEARRHYLGDRVSYAESSYAALEGADALVIHTEWMPYRRPDFDRMKSALRSPAIFDGRNLYDPARMAAMGFDYHCIGRRAPEEVE